MSQLKEAIEILGLGLLTVEAINGSTTEDDALIEEVIRTQNQVLAKFKEAQEQPLSKGTIEETIKELIFRAVHNHEVDIDVSVHPAELKGFREILKEKGKLYMGDV